MSKDSLQKLIDNLKEDILDSVMSEVERLFQELAQGLPSMDFGAFKAKLKGEKPIAGVDYQIPKDGKNYVVDGFRYPDQIDTFRRVFDGNFRLVAVDAPVEKRFSYCLKRNREGDPTTWEEFLEVEQRDQRGYLQRNGQNTARCLTMADAKIFNFGTLEELEESGEKFLNEIGYK